MRILFSEFSFGAVQGNKWFNSGIAALSAYLRREGHEVFLLNYIDGSDESAYVAGLREIAPDLLAFSTMSFQWETTARLAGIAKGACPGLPVVVGGYHSTFHTAEVMACPHVDFACRGEGEEPLLDLVDALEGRRGLDPRTIASLWCRRPDGAIVQNPTRPPFPDLDRLPYWDRDLWDYRSLMKERGRACFYFETDVMALTAARGCPYTCTYCSNESYLRLYRGLGRFPRVRSVSNVIEELRYLRSRYDVGKFEFWDEIFGTNPRWMAEFSAAYRSGLAGVPYGILLRIEQTRNDTFMRQLAESGCSTVSMGIEHGDEAFRKKHLGRNMSNEEIVSAFRKCRDLGIETTSYNMLGLPFETPELMRATLEFNRVVEPDNIQIFIFQPFPGTKLYDVCRENGWIPDRAAKPYWFLQADKAIRQPTYSPEDVIAVHDEWARLKADLIGKSEARRRARGFAGPPAEPRSGFEHAIL